MMILNYWGEIIFSVFCIATIVQLYYYIAIFSRLAYYEVPQKSQSQQQPVSVIICAKDEANNIVRNLPGVLVQSYPTSNEVILVNDNSTDDTKYLIEEFKRTFKHLMPIELTQGAKMIPGKKFPLSMGIKSAKYETLLLTDADCVPASEHWIQLMQDGYRAETEIVLGYGAYAKYKGILNKIIRFETFHSALQYLSYALAGMPYMGVGRNLSYKKEVFFKNKGFSSINFIPGGDDDLFINKAATKTNTAVVINPNAHTLSEPKKTWREWFSQKTRHFSTAKYYQPKHKWMLGLYSATQFLIYPFLILAIVSFNWWIALIIFTVRLIVQGFIYSKTMKKLNEEDLFPFFFMFELWMCAYYVIFLPALFRKAKKSWN